VSILSALVEFFRTKGRRLGGAESAMFLFVCFSAQFGGCLSSLVSCWNEPLRKKSEKRTSKGSTYPHKYTKHKKQLQMI